MLSMIAVTTQHPHTTALHWGHTFFRWMNKHKHQVVNINVLWLRYTHVLYSDAQTQWELKHHVVMSNVMWFKYACVLARAKGKMADSCSSSSLACQPLHRQLGGSDFWDSPVAPIKWQNAQKCRTWHYWVNALCNLCSIAMATEERCKLCGKLVLAGERRVLGAATSRHALDCLLSLRPSASERLWCAVNSRVMFYANTAFLRRSCLFA